MAKKAAAKPKKASQKKHSKLYNFTYKHTALVVVGVLAVLVLGYLGVRQYQITQEKKQFAQAELVLADLSKAIQKELGEPISSETVKQCAYASAKYVKGGPRCSVSFTINYPNLGLEEMKQKQFSILTLVKTAEKLDLSSNNYSTFENEWSTGAYKESDSSFKINNNSLVCSESISIENNNPVLSIDFGCYKDTKKEYFPVKE